MRSETRDMREETGDRRQEIGDSRLKLIYPPPPTKTTIYGLPNPPPDMIFYV